MNFESKNFHESENNENTINSQKIKACLDIVEVQMQFNPVRLKDIKNRLLNFEETVFFEKTEIDFDAIPEDAQADFIISDAYLHEEERDKLYNFLKIQREEGLSFFIDIIQTKSVLAVNMIEALEKIDSSHLRIINEKLSELTEKLQSLNLNLEKKGVSSEEIQAGLNDVVNNFYKKVLSIFRQVDLEADNKEDLRIRREGRLMKINTDSLILIPKIRMMNDADSLNSNETEDMSEEISKTNFVEYEGSEFTDLDQQQIKEIYELNYSSMPNLKERLYKTFLVSLDKKNSIYKIIRSEGKIVAVCAFEYLEDGSVYFGKFNVHPSYQGSKVGSEVINNTLKEYMKNYKIKADCNIESTISSKYIEKGFIALRGYDMDETKSLEILYDNNFKDFKTKKWGKLSIRLQAKTDKEVSLEDGRYIIYACDINNIKKNTPLGLLDTVNSDGSRYILTRYIREETPVEEGTSKRVYFVFEKVEKEIVETELSK